MSTHYYLEHKAIRDLKEILKERYGDEEIFNSFYSDISEYTKFNKEIGANSYFYEGDYFKRDVLILCKYGDYQIVDEYGRIIDVEDYLHYVNTGEKRW